jgi:hypothetical protein
MREKVFGAQLHRRTDVIIVDCISKPFLFARRIIDARSEDISQHLFPI